MTDCKESVQIIGRASDLDLTPRDEPEETAIAQAKPTTDVAANEPNPELVAAGQVAFKKCKACHQVGDGARNKVGPHLNGIFGRAAGAVDGFRYSRAMNAANSDGLIWAEAELTAFLRKPRAFLKGTKMTFSGFKSDQDIRAIMAYLQTFQP